MRNSVQLTTLELISGFSNLWPVLFGLYFYRRLNLTLKIFLAFTFVLLILDIAGIYLASIGIENLRLFAVLTLVEFSLLMVILSRWQAGKKVRRGLLILVPVFGMIWICAKLTIEPLNMWDFYTAPLASALIMAGALYTLFILNGNQVDDPLKEHRFWILTGLLFYYGGNIFIFAFSGTIIVWSIHNVLNIIANICYAGGFISIRHSHFFGLSSSGHQPS